jgi:demethylmenaquinone methyltransferase/2-methoxy-6-polyprenyl-1,4-benzoquinol methylase
MDDDQAKVLRVLTTRDETRAFYNKIAKVYDLLSEKSEEPIRRYGLETLAVRTGERILEVGFGTGVSLAELADLVGDQGKVFGVDLAEKMLEVAKHRLRDRGLEDRVELACADAISLPYKSDSIDGILMSFTLELFDTPEIPVVLSECWRVLRLGGRIVVISISKGGEPGAIRKIFEWTHQHFPNFLDCRPIYAERSMKAAGFEIENAQQKSMWVPVEIVLGRKA